MADLNGNGIMDELELAAMGKGDEDNDVDLDEDEQKALGEACREEV